MVAYGHIEYSTYQVSEESKGVEFNPPPGRTEKSVVLGGLRHLVTSTESSNPIFVWKSHIFLYTCATCYKLPCYIFTMVSTKKFLFVFN